MSKPADLLQGRGSQAEGFWYTAKRRLLGPPLVNQELGEQRLSNPLALGVLSPDGISSSAYGTEEILIALLPVAGLAAFTLIMPLTLVVLLVMTLVVLSYREIVMVYIRPGGSYVVARENFGPRVAQVAAVALLIDYVVTVAVQIAAGTAAVASAIPAVGPYKLEICVGVVLIMCYGNLRGLKEAGRAFAVPTYLFAGSVILMIVVGLIREAFGDLPVTDPHTLHGTYEIGSGTAGIISFAMIFTLLRAFANGGASLTGIEAVSDAVGAFRPPEGINARRVLVTEGVILGTLVLGISWLAHVTRATPYVAGYPTVLAQEAQAVFGQSAHFMYFVLQLATMLILYTGGNTSFNGFPFLTSYVAGDSFLPRWMLKRGHRLVFSNAIILLTIVSVALLIIKDANVNNLVPLYAIGVFTAFSMAGFGMAKYHYTRREQVRDQLVGRHNNRDRRGDLRRGEVHRGRLGGARAVRRPCPRADPAERRVPGGVRGARGGQLRGTAPAAALLAAGRVRLRGQLRPRHARRAPLRAQPAADHDPRGALRHRQRAGGKAAGEVDAGRSRRCPRLHRRPGPPAGEGGQRPGGAGDRGPRHLRHGDLAAAQLFGAPRPPAA
jgi:amino acid transporter